MTQEFTGSRRQSHLAVLRAVACAVVPVFGTASATAFAQAPTGRTPAERPEAAEPLEAARSVPGAASEGDAQAPATVSRGEAAVVVECLALRSPLLEEALIRARAEVAAAGLLVIAPEEQGTVALPAPWSQNPDVHGRLSFEQFGSIIRIEALAPGLSAPVVQTIDSEAPSVDAEVIAVRAVETLRAAMVQYASLAGGADRELPAAVGKFTRVKAKRKPRSSRPKKQRRLRSNPPPKAPAASPAGVLLSLWVAPEAHVDLRAGEASGGGRVQFYGGADWYFVGAGVRQVWALNSIVRDQGSVIARHTDVELSLKLQGAVGPNTSVYLATTGGYRQYVIEGRAVQPYYAFDRQHATAVGSIELGAAQWLADEFGVFLGCGVTAAANSPHLYFAGDSVAALDRPSLWVSLGVVAGQR